MWSVTDNGKFVGSGTGPTRDICEDALVECATAYTEGLERDGDQ